VQDLIEVETGKNFDNPERAEKDENENYFRGGVVSFKRNRSFELP
jgi:hypothetical protein